VAPDGFDWERCLGREWRESPWHLVGFDGQLFLSRWYPAGSDVLQNLEEDLAAVSATLVALLSTCRVG
jgi:hypothetical protein